VLRWIRIVIRKAAKKYKNFSGPTTKRGRGKGLATKKKELFLKLEKKIFSKKMWQLSSRGEGGEALVTGPFKKKNIF